MKYYADWVLEKYVLNELPKHELKEMTLALENNPRLQKRVEELKKSNNEILNRCPASTQVPQILDRLRLEKAREEAAASRASASGKQLHWSRRLFIASPILAAAILLIVFLSPFSSTLQDGTRIKGKPAKSSLLVFRKINGNIEQLHDKNRAKAGDLLQLKYKVPENTYGIIISIDGNGTVTLHFPENRQSSTQMKANREISLPMAYELDNAPWFERFFLLTSNRPLNVNAVIQAADNLAQVPANARTDTISMDNQAGTTGQTSILLNKGEQP